MFLHLLYHLFYFFAFGDYRKCPKLLYPFLGPTKLLIVAVAAVDTSCYSGRVATVSCTHLGGFFCLSVSAPIAHSASGTSVVVAVIVAAVVCCCC